MICLSKESFLTKLAHSLLLSAIFSLTIATSAAETLTGTVTNGTTNKPAAGDEVILINLASGMDIAGSTKVDASGKFSFSITGGPGPHLIRAIHQGVTYHQMAPPGTNSVDLNVYDVAQKVAGLSVTADVFRFQADNSTMQGVRLFVVNNTSSPAKTQLNDHNFEFFLPVGSKLEQVQARAPNGQPIAAEAVPQSEKNKYALNFPLRPGETQFQLEFTLPYTGEIKIDPKLQYPAEHFVVVLPKSIQFKAANPPSFQSEPDPTQSGSTVEVAKETKVGQPLAFTLKGTGVITESPAETASNASQQQDQPAPGPSQAGDSRPGGGLGPPIEAPDALQQYRWPILFGFAVLLAVGGWMVTRRQGGPDPQYCLSCGAVGKPQFRKSGSTWTEVFLWLLAILPGAIYSVWRLTTKRWVCAKCGQTGIIPLDSPNVPSHVALSARTVPSPRATLAPDPLSAPVTTPGPSKIVGKVSANASARGAAEEASGAPSVSTPAAKSSLLLEALKEELFQLEVEKKQGKITPEEYEKAKAALDQTLDRALRRQS
jgi:hypothetical protein